MVNKESSLASKARVLTYSFIIYAVLIAVLAFFVTANLFWGITILAISGLVFFPMRLVSILIEQNESQNSN